MQINFQHIFSKYAESNNLENNEVSSFLPQASRAASELSGIEALHPANATCCFDDSVAAISGCCTSPYATDGKSKQPHHSSGKEGCFICLMSFISCKITYSLFAALIDIYMVMFYFQNSEMKKGNDLYFVGQAFWTQGNLLAFILIAAEQLPLSQINWVSFYDNCGL